MTKEITPQEAMEFFQKMWNPLGLQFPGMASQQGGGQPGSGQSSAAASPFGLAANPISTFMNFNPEDVEKKINEFKIVETWLNMQISMLQMTIKTMEMQKASLEALRTQTQSLSGGTTQTKSGGGTK